MIFQCLRRACLYILPSKVTVILGVEDQRYCCGLVVFVCLFVFCIADDLTSKETVEDGLRMALRPACAKIVQSLSSLYDIWCPGFLFHQIVSLCKYSLYRGAKYTRSYSLQPEKRSWRSFLISFSGRYAQRNIPDKYRSMVYVLKTKVRAHTLRSTWLRKDSFIKIHARNIS